jgi:hypothetical protein
VDPNRGVEGVAGMGNRMITIGVTCVVLLGPAMCAMAAIGSESMIGCVRGSRLERLRSRLMRLWKSWASNYEKPGRQHG